MPFANFGQRLRAARQAQQLSLRRLSEDTGISFSQISRLERQKHAPRADDAERLARALGTTTTALTRGELDPVSPPRPLVPGTQQELLATYPLTRITRLGAGRTTNLSRIARASPSWTAVVVRGRLRVSGPALEAVVSAGAKLCRKVLTQHTVHAEALEATELLWIEEAPRLELQISGRATRSETASDVVVGYVCGGLGRRTECAAAHELIVAGCSVVFQDHITNASLARPQLIAAFDRLGLGSTLLTPNLRALGLRTHEVLELVSTLERRAVRFRTLDDKVDTQRPGTTDLIAALAILEPSPRSSRVSAGSRAARAGQKSLGRPPSLRPNDVEELRKLVSEGFSTSAIRQRLGFTKSTVERYVRRIREGVL